MNALVLSSQFAQPAQSIQRPATSHAVALNPWAMVPPLGNIEAYISAVKKLPMLSLEEEQTLSRALQTGAESQSGLDAAQKLVLSHLKLVVSTARGYLGYGLPHADLIQEGNIGLLKAVRNFDPGQGVRLATYALHWIKAEIHEYVLKNWRMVKVATTKAQRKLFFNLRSLKNGLRAEKDAQLIEGDVSDISHAPQLLSHEVDAIAKRLDVKPAEVIEMNQRLYGADVSLEPLRDEGEDEAAFAPIAYLSDTGHEPSAVLERTQRDHMAHQGVADALAQLDPRSRRIVTERWLNVNDEGTGGLTLHDLAAEYGISAERVRQIEAAALKKMKAAMS